MQDDLHTTKNCPIMFAQRSNATRFKGTQFKAVRGATTMDLDLVCTLVENS